MLSEHDTSILADYFGNRSGVVAAFLFGSLARGEGRSGSDVDIAVLVDRLAPKNPLLAAEIASEVMGLLRRNDVDVVVVNQAPPVLKHRVARDGAVLYARSNSDVAEFVLRALQEYVDTKPLRDLEQAQLRRWIDEHKAEKAK